MLSGKKIPKMPKTQQRVIRHQSGNEQIVLATPLS
jgi:hypothetical protein